MLQDFKFLSAVAVANLSTSKTSFWTKTSEEQATMYRTAMLKALAKKASESGRGVDEKIFKLVENATQVELKTAGQPALRFTKSEADNYGNSCEWSVTLTTSKDFSEVISRRLNIGSVRPRRAVKTSAS